MTDPSKTTNPERRRHTLIVALAVGITLLFAAIFSQQAFDLPFLRPDTNEQTLIFAALSALIFLLLVALTFVLVRTLLKLYAERRGGVVGSRFRTRMVVGALVLSFGPVIFLFLFAYGLMNRSIDKWFSRPVEEVRENTTAVASLLANYAAHNARAEALSIAQSPDTQKAFATGNFAGVMNDFRQHDTTLEGGFAFALLGNDAEASYHAPDLWPVLRGKLPEVATMPAQRPHPIGIAGRQYIFGTAAVGKNGRILVALPLPEDFSTVQARVEQSERRYLELSRERKLVRRTYMGLLLLLTVLVLFAATWFALFLSKFVTRPVAALAAATEELSRGRLHHRVQVPAGDELGALVQSFNRMAEELETTRRQIEASSQSLAHANDELEQRRRHMEIILESSPTGVLSIDAQRRITHMNTAIVRMFEPRRPSDDGVRFTIGKSLNESLPADVAADLEHLMRKADRMGTATSQMEVTLPTHKLDLAVTVASLEMERQRLGYVLVFEDLSDLLKAQKQLAWREVARRVAHEIKNPLTPIALSAERIRRHLERGTPPDDASLAVIHGCAATIGGAVETVRSLVNEFSSLASFPTAQPKPSDMNTIVESALALFEGRLEDLRVQKFLAPDLPKVQADPEAMKRAIANLVDNAVEATQTSLVREIQISTSLLGAKDAVEIVVADTGQGVTPDVKEKLFLPYFSTKKRGTGLGLAIVSRIIEDHRGSIRVEENLPVGTRFIVELPVAQEGAEATAGQDHSAMSNA